MKKPKEIDTTKVAHIGANWPQMSLLDMAENNVIVLDDTTDVHELLRTYPNMVVDGGNPAYQSPVPFTIDMLDMPDLVQGYPVAERKSKKGKTRGGNTTDKKNRFSARFYRKLTDKK